MQTRRAVLLTIAGAATAPLIAQHAGHAIAEAGAPPLSYDPTFFPKPDYAIVSRLADLILPRTDTPGALDAHVPFRIDQQAASSPELQGRLAAGLNVLRAANFVALPEPEQIDMLKSISENPDSAQGQFFQTIKELTVEWYYRSEEGLVKELGFHGNTFRSEFPGCTHPEHWPVLETK